jgi:alkanesulfonate monooxygenase SsuD/methylene tetrahydromethanopterin reductase-like flavin-dependent oxidoreductase (luciferase family)
MKLGYFTMPVHPLHRNYTQTLREDRAAIILADELGYDCAFVGEHVTDRSENITNSMLFLATLIHSTTHIKLATGTTNLAHMHPTLVAVNAAMFDHLSEGRFILGISAGALPTDAEALGFPYMERNQIFAEAIDVILEIWKRDPPYDIDLPDNRFKVSTGGWIFPEVGVGLMVKPYQQPRPEIVGTVVAPYSQGVIRMGERDFHPLSANFLQPKWVATHWPNYVQGKTNSGVTADTADWRVARTIFVADDDRVAKAYGRDDANSPFRYYYRQMAVKFKKAGLLGVFKHERDEPDEAVTVERVLDDLVICGTVDEVVDEILAFRETVGEFGTLVVAGMDWVDEALSRRSMQLLAEQVMPRVNAAIGEDASKAAE